MSQTKNRLKQYLVNLKGDKCNICGYKDSLPALHFHHVNPFEKSFNISSKNSLSEELIQELNKCVLLCSRCHNEVHDGLIDIEYLSELLFDTQLEV